jgi:hypothetical protein
MIRVPQSIQHPSPQANSLSACVASILELSLLVVPNFTGDYGESWIARFLNWLEPMDLSVMFLQYSKDQAPPPGLAILTTSCPGTGVQHSVVMKDGKLAWDPSPEKKKKLGEPKYWAVFVATNPAKFLPRPLFEKIIF